MPLGIGVCHRRLYPSGRPPETFGLAICRAVRRRETPLHGESGDRVFGGGSLRTGNPAEAAGDNQISVRPAAPEARGDLGPPRLVAQIAFAEWTKDGKLRQPAFLGLRDDKKPSECQWRKRERRVSGEWPARRRKREPDEAVRVAGLEITHPHKIWWPEEKITKLDVVQYYAAAARHILPWLDDHPLTAERCPDGMKGQCFFQKNFRGALPPDIRTRAIRAETTEEVVHYVVGGSKGTLFALVNLGCIAVHLMNCRIASLDHPEWLAFDLDPSAGKFSDAAKARIILQKILSELRILSFPKTSGGKGLHVFIPLKRGPSQEEARQFAHRVGEEMVKRSPELITVQMAKSKRRGRVFIDWLRNAFGQTIAAPFSVRRRPRAPISTPLHWEEVDPKLDPTSFNLSTIEQRFKGKDPWADFRKHPQRLPDLKL
jgi:bifunctional non-homologous end joining protein LigD